MDWWKLFALLVAVTTIQTTAEAPKKKIRIHLPQKVKHIHHHKKIYITNHPAPSQYAPAFMPSAEGAVAVPTNVAVPAVANMMPVNSMELYDEAPGRMPGLSAAASKLLPLYRARGYYGPTPQEWDDQDYDLAPPPEQSAESYIPTAFSAPVAATIPPAYPPKRVKIVKLNEPSRKKVPRKAKPKRVPLRGKPQLEEEHPVTTFHEQFYSDVDGSGTIRKVRKPPRVEKIIDGDTEHIHTYSEEHIHKLVYDDGSKLPGMVGIDPMGGISALAASHHPIMPIKNPLIAIPPGALTGFAAVGSMGTPSHLEYAAYNPREVTHDHIFHDHGEIPSGVDITRDHLPFPPKLTYNNRGVPIGLGGKGLKSKYSHKYLKPHSKPTDLSYYESIYNLYGRVNPRKPTVPIPYDPASEVSLEGYRRYPTFKLKDKPNVKPRNVVPALYFGNGKQVPQANLQSPYSVSSTVVHEYKPKDYLGAAAGAAGVTKYNKGLYNYPNSDELDSYGSTYYVPDAPAPNYPAKKGKKKSVSTQNVHFSGLDHQTTVDHMEDSGASASSLDAVIPSALDNYNYDQQKALVAVPSTAFTIRESSPVHPYYATMAEKALHNDQLTYAESSNANYQYVEAPTAPTNSAGSSVETTVPPTAEYYDIQSTESTTPEPANYEPKSRNVPKDRNPNTEHKPRYKILALQTKEFVHEPKQKQYSYSEDAPNILGKLKYGDKI